NLLSDLQRRLGLAYIFISHDLAVVKHIADRIAVMHLGRIVEIGPNEALFANPLHPYSRALLSAIPVPVPGAKRERIILRGEMPSALNPPAGCPFHPRCPVAVARCETERPELVGGSHATACHRASELPPGANVVPRRGGRPPALEQLMNAFRHGADRQGGAGVDTVEKPPRGGGRGPMKTVRLAAAAAVLVLSSAIACAQTTLRIGLAEDPDALDPTLARTYVGRIVFASFCDKLFDIDEKLNAVPQLALGYETAPDGKAVTIKLRPNVKFHDGETLDA